MCFQWQGDLFRSTCLPNRLASGPGKFTKLTKVLFVELRQASDLKTSYVNDSLLLARIVKQCIENARATVQMSDEVGFTVHLIKLVVNLPH